MSREKTAVFSPPLACKFYHAGDFFARGFMDLKCSCNIKEGLILQSPLRGSWIRGILHYYIGYWRGGLIMGFCYIIRKLRFACDFYSGFTRGEYHIVCVDFIVALRRTKGRGRRTLRSPPSPSSGLHLIHPGLSAAAGHFGCRG